MNATTNPTPIDQVTFPETTFGATEVGNFYLTSRGHKVEVVEVVAGSHAIVQNAKGKETRMGADQTCYGPLPVTVEVETPVEGPATDAAPLVEGATDEAAPSLG